MRYPFCLTEPLAVLERSSNHLKPRTIESSVSSGTASGDLFVIPVLVLFDYEVVIPKTSVLSFNFDYEP